MGRKTLFTVRMNSTKRLILVTLDERLRRTESDTVRWLVRQKAEELELTFNSGDVVNGGDIAQ